MLSIVVGCRKYGYKEEENKKGEDTDTLIEANTVNEGLHEDTNRQTLDESKDRGEDSEEESSSSNDEENNDNL